MHYLRKETNFRRVCNNQQDGRLSMKTVAKGFPKSMFNNIIQYKSSLDKID